MWRHPPLDRAYHRDLLARNQQLARWRTMITAPRLIGKAERRGYREERLYREISHSVCGLVHSPGALMAGSAVGAAAFPVHLAGCAAVSLAWLDL